MSSAGKVLDRNKVPVPPWSMVDDIIGVSKYGSDTVELLSYLNTKTNLKKIQYGASKCVKMHFGQKSKVCPKLKV